MSGGLFGLLEFAIFARVFPGPQNSFIASQDAQVQVQNSYADLCFTLTGT